MRLLLVLLLLETSDVVHVDGVETALGLLLVGGQLLLLHRLQTNGGVVANAHNQHTPALVLAIGVLLVGEGDVNFRDVVWRVRRRVGVAEHGGTITADVDGT